MFVVDTNLLVYAAIREAPRYRTASRLVADWAASAEAWFTTWSVVYEFLRVVTHVHVAGPTSAGQARAGPLLHTFSSTKPMAAESRCQLASSWSKYLRPAGVSE